jgi:hypothetical protein
MGRQLGIGLLIGAGLYTACELILMALGIYRIDGLNPLSYLIPAVAMAISSSVFEEMLFRGVLFRSVETWFGSWAALVVSSLVFGLTHLVNPQATLEGALFIAVEAGILLGAAVMLTRRLWLSIGFHMAWNYTQSAIFSGIVSGNDAAPGWIRSTVKGPDYLTGGSFGVESSVLALVLCTTTGIVMLVMAHRRGLIVPPIWKRSGLILRLNHNVGGFGRRAGADPSDERQLRRRRRRRAWRNRACLQSVLRNRRGAEPSARPRQVGTTHVALPSVETMGSSGLSGTAQTRRVCA